MKKGKASATRRNRGAVMPAIFDNQCNPQLAELSIPGQAFTVSMLLTIFLPCFPFEANKSAHLDQFPQVLRQVEIDVCGEGCFRGMR